MGERIQPLNLLQLPRDKGVQPRSIPGRVCSITTSFVNRGMAGLSIAGVSFTFQILPIDPMDGDKQLQGKTALKALLLKWDRHRIT